jgi:FAD:protein FMN transferase
MSHRPVLTSLLAMLAAALLLPAGGCSRVGETIEITGDTMGTTYSVKVAAAPAAVDSNVLRATIDDVLGIIDRSMSGYRADSEISRFNASTATDWVAVSRELATVVLAASEVSEQSGGAFDVTVAPLVQAWGFGPAGEPAALPEAARLAKLRAEVGYRKLHARADPPALRKDLPALSVDLNGIAPGYAVDLLAQRFESLHVENFMIDIGGEVRARGRNAHGAAWRIAVERPVDAEPAPYAIVRLEDRAVTTSGEYRHYYIRDGHRYSHTIDPRTGRPVEHDLAAVVVMGPTSMQADAWATALNVLGTQAGYAMAAQRGIAALFIARRDAQLYARATPQFESKIVWREGGS